MTPAPLDRAKLARVLGMLGSAHDGEACAAARHADALVRRAGLTWHDVVAAHDPQPLLEPVGFNSANQIRFCLLHRHRLSEWEKTFLASIRNQSAPLSARQRNCLASIVDKLRARAEAA